LRALNDLEDRAYRNAGLSDSYSAHLKREAVKLRWAKKKESEAQSLASHGHKQSHKHHHGHEHKSRDNYDDIKAWSDRHYAEKD